MEITLTISRALGFAVIRRQMWDKLPFCPTPYQHMWRSITAIPKEPSPEWGGSLKKMIK
jgi:hypothetical protein